MFNSFILRQNQEININSASNNVNLYTLAGSPKTPINIYCFINSQISSNSGSSYAFQTGTGWASGTYLYIKNSNTIIGMANTTVGANGVGGIGGNGANYPANGVSGSSGGAGANGNIGGPSFAANTVAGVKILLNNIGTISGGNGSIGGSGGGGGGGGAGAGYG